MAPHGTPHEKVERLALAAFEHGSISAGAAAERIPLRTARRIATTPAYKAALAETRRAALETTVARLGAAGVSAVDRLRVIMMDGNTPAGVAVRAALGILSSLVALENFASLEERIRTLEQLFDEKPAPPSYRA